MKVKANYSINCDKGYFETGETFDIEAKDLLMYGDAVTALEQPKKAEPEKKPEPEKPVRKEPEQKPEKEPEKSPEPESKAADEPGPAEEKQATRSRKRRA